MKAAVADKDRHIEEMRGVLEKQKRYGDELEREMNQLSNECLTQEEIMSSAIRERDESRRTVAELHAQAADYLS